MTHARLRAAALVSFVVVATTAAHAEEARATGSFREEDLESRVVRDDSRTTYGMAEAGVGLFTLPAASVCGRNGEGCQKGDQSLAFSGWPLFRRGHFAAGAGIMVGITSRADKGDDTQTFPRDHTRRYYSFEATARYYVSFAERIEGWGGITTGLGVVNDSFQSQTGVSELATPGPRAVTMLTEGYTLGVGVGVGYAFAEKWRVGARARIAGWFLPGTPAHDSLGDQASLSGQILTMDFGITLAYRTRLVF